ncbi:protein phosphatase 1 regulatory subunit 11 [Paragonimus westermani]|uniref:E3 ubiquitin-protein ligase PPP1R11 n=1 Tax=Paragonimus westermani TaxID=34504 RepID=A0A5J4N9G0_9TREM|nr:protein phosphatase 1 regulatory subunit 11 [Paragonimus westermani]
MRYDDKRRYTAILLSFTQPLLLRAHPSDLQNLRDSTQQPDTSHGIRWQEGTVDNEFLGRKKSKCCCIYKKPRRWDESSSSSSSSSSDTEEHKPTKHAHCTEHCHGHTRHCYRKKNTGQTSNPNASGSPSTEPPTSHESNNSLNPAESIANTQ